MADRVVRRGRPWCISRIVLLLLLALLLSSCTSPSVNHSPPGEGNFEADPDFRAPSGVLFARPASPEEDNTTLRLFGDLVKNTPSGEKIRIVAHSFSFVPAAEALADAHRRGVNVQVIVDRSISGSFKATAVLRAELGTNRRAPSFVYAAPGEMHQKTWSFTRTGQSRDVVLVGSTNLTYQSARQYTDVVSYVGRRDVRRVFDRRFEALVEDLPQVRIQTSAALGVDRVWFYPGVSSSTDPVSELLGEVPASGTRIRVVMYAWLDGRGIALARLLAAKAAAGAQVQVVLGPSIGGQILEILRTSRIETFPGVFADGDEVHHKLTLVSRAAPDGGEDPERFVLTGSDNFTTASLQRPEVLLRLDGSKGRRYERYDRWVDDLIGRG